MSKSKTAIAAEKAVAKSQMKAVVERTPSERLTDIRKNLEARLAVPPDDQRFLLESFDTAVDKCLELQIKVQELTDKNAEFRAVYEAENSSKVLRVDVVDTSADVPCGTLIEEPVAVFGDHDES